MTTRNALRRVRAAPWPGVVRHSPAARRISRHLFDPPKRLQRMEPTVQPIGAKLELTFACNLRCGFCYTDSPRHTLARTPELDEAAWSRVVDDVIALGIIEAVVTGGEPLLRRDLALDVIERLDRAGVAVYLNTNGWFVDDAVADRLAAARSLRVYVSIDGAASARHDAMRGVPGSWRRAAEGAARLLDRGVPTRITHVVTPENRAEVDEALTTFARLGVPSVHLAPVSLIGAAARGGDWDVDRIALFGQRDEARLRLGGMNVEVRGSDIGDFDPLHNAPATFLVRPDGVVRISSSVPFSFGHVDDGVAACWEQIRAGWNSEDVVRWIEGVKRRSRLADADVVPYLDGDAPLAADVTPAPGGRTAPRPEASRSRRPDPLADIAAAREHVTALALARRFRLGGVRWIEGDAGGRFVREIATGNVTRLNATAKRVMQACDGGTPDEAVAVLADLHPDVAREGIVDDVVAAVRMLETRRIIVPALAPEGARAGGEDVPASALTA